VLVSQGQRSASERAPLQRAHMVNEMLGMDTAVDFGISGEYVTRVVDRAALFRGCPGAVHKNNGPHFTNRAFSACRQAHGVRHVLIQPGRSM